MLNYPIDLDVSAGAVPAVIHLKQYQTDAQLVFRLYTTVGTLSIGNVSDCSIRGTKSDGNGFSASASYSSSNNTVSYHVTSQMTAVAGKQPYELTLTDSTGKMITATFYLDIKRAALDGNTISNSVIRELIDALDHTDEILQAYNEAAYDNVPTSGSVHAVKSGGIYQVIANLSNVYQTILTFDSVPTTGSTNPVTSAGIKTAIANVMITVTDANSDGNIVITMGA